jgi:hypothetical protein
MNYIELHFVDGIASREASGLQTVLASEHERHCRNGKARARRRSKSAVAKLNRPSRGLIVLGTRGQQAGGRAENG